MHCNAALPLVPAYLDGEVSEAQAAPLRQHLLSCAACRNRAQDEKSLKRWFAAGRDQPVAVPPGFAPRVARRALAGDTGERDLPAALPAEEPGRILRFVLQLTAVAAAAMLVLAIALRSHELPAGDDLRAEDRVVPSVEEVVRALEALNAEEIRAETEASESAGDGAGDE